MVGGSVRTGRLVSEAARAHGAAAVERVDVDGAADALADRRPDGVVIVPSARMRRSAALVEALLAALATDQHPVSTPVALVTSFVVGHGAHHALNDGAERAADRLAAEARLRRSRLPHVILRPTWLTDDLPGRATVRLTQDPETDGLIARADLAAVCLTALFSPEAWCTTFALHAEPGPPADLHDALAALTRDPAP